jgi:hypothetical protein
LAFHIYTRQVITYSAYLIQIKLLDELIELSEEAIEHGRDLHSCQLVAERGEADDVSEEDGHHVLLLNLWLDAILQGFGNMLGKHLYTVILSAGICGIADELIYLLQDTILTPSLQPSSQEGLANRGIA